MFGLGGRFVGGGGVLKIDYEVEKFVEKFALRIFLFVCKKVCMNFSLIFERKTEFGRV